MTKARQRLGAGGERIVARCYTDQGYVVLAQNWSCRDDNVDGELDLVLADPHGLIVFCEVKTRRSDRFGTGLDAVTSDKQRRVRVLAYRWLAEHGEHGEQCGVNGMNPATIRFDVASVDVSTTPITITFVHDAF